MITSRKVASILVTDGARALVVSKSGHNSRVTLPKGGRELTDLDSMDAALRELKEEAGITQVPRWMTHPIATATIWNEKDERLENHRGFYAQLDSGDFDLLLQQAESPEGRTVTSMELTALLHYPHLHTFHKAMIATFLMEHT